ncbi:MFS transporter [Occultella gossypii]|uniref:MFS transporter n=1 Tax=Occultella gossypii TaxID=2800820 RepID=A0ABS7S8D3_9MICO|nr:MFS transporter [Occultella gossypii]MBZ2195879.1 MFS transporter [Occultella gossypii]
MSTGTSLGTAAATTPSSTRPASWWAVVTLGLGIFTLVASEFLPASLLTPIAAGLGVSEGVAGQLVTATAVAGILAGPAIVALLPPIDRRWVMIALTGLSIASNVLVALVPNLALMLLGRALLGISLSGFWALSLAVVSQLVPPQRLGRAMMIVNTGVSLATVAAVPIGAYLGAQLGWQAVFLGAALAGALTLILQLTALPRMEAGERSGLRPLLATLSTPIIAVGFAALALLVTGHFAAFTYVRPMLDEVDGITTGLLAVLLASYGVASFVGNLVAGLLADRHLRPLLVVVPIMVAAGTVALAVAGTSLPVTIVAIAAWGTGFGAVPTMVQTWLGHVAPDRLESGGALTVTTFQTSIALGAAFGGLLFDTLDVGAVFLAAAIAAALGTLIFSRVRTS